MHGFISAHQEVNCVSHGYYATFQKLSIAKILKKYKKKDGSQDSRQGFNSLIPPSALTRDSTRPHRPTFQKTNTMQVSQAQARAIEAAREANGGVLPSKLYLQTNEQLSKMLCDLTGK